MSILVLVVVGLATGAVAVSGFADGWLQLWVILSSTVWLVLGWVLLARYTRSKTRGRE